MNANEFVKKFGIEEAIKVVDLHPISTLINIDGSCVSVSDLKQIVDAFELVESYGGLNEAIEATGTSYIKPSDWEDLNNSINLVEQCYA